MTAAERDELADGLDALQARRDDAGGPMLEVQRRQPEQMVEDVTAEHGVDAVARVQDQVLAHPASAPPVNTMNTAMPMPSAISVLSVRWTTTLSMIACVNSGNASAISCSTSEASRTSRQMRCA